MRWQRGAAVSVLALVGLVASILVWNNLLREQIFPKRWAEVATGRLYRSGQVSPRLVHGALAEHEIGLVVDLTAFDPESDAQRAEARAIRALDIEYVSLPLRGHGDGAVSRYAEAIAQIVRAEREGTPVLVHCAAGARRSGGVIAAYQVLVEGRDPRAAFEELSRFGGRTLAETPLVAFLNESMEPIARELVAMGVIPRVPAPIPRFPEPG